MVSLAFCVYCSTTVNFALHAHPIAAGYNLVYSSIHSAETDLALGLLLDSCGSSCPFRLQAN